MLSRRNRTPGRLNVFLLAVLLAAVAGSSLSAQEPDTDPVATRKYSVALGFQKKKLYDQAAGRWQQFIKAYPKHPRLATAYHHLGVCQIQQQKFAEATANFQHILKTFPKFPSLDSAQFNLGLALYNTALAADKPEAFKPAIAAFAELPAKHGKSPHVPTALFYQAECLVLSGDLANSVPVYQKLISGFPKSELLPQAQYAPS